MTTAVVDTSVAIKWFSEQNEDDVDIARMIYKRARLGEVVLHSPDFLLIEISNVFVKSKKLQKFAIRSAQKYLGSGIIQFTPSVDLLEGMNETMENLQLSAYDALCVALSRQLDCPLLTEDKKILSNYPKAINLSSMEK